MNTSISAGTTHTFIQIENTSMIKTVHVQGVGHGPLHYIVPKNIFDKIPLQLTIGALDRFVHHRRIYDIPLRITDDDNLTENIRLGNIGRIERQSIDILPVFRRQYNKAKSYEKNYDSQNEVDAAFSKVKHILKEVPTLMDQAHNRLTPQGEEWLRGISIDRPSGYTKRSKTTAPVQPMHASFRQPVHDDLDGDPDGLYKGGRKRTQKRKRKRKTR